MDYAPYLVVCRDQTLAGAYEKFQWQENVPRQKTRGNRHCHGVTPVPTSWHRFASVEISSALDSVKSALSWRRSTTDTQGTVAAGCPSSSTGTGTPQAKRSTKKVSFADEAGLALTTVRIICDSVSSSSSNSAVAYRRSLAAFRILIKFAQPWSCSDTFRKKVEARNVILSNFVIKDGVINGEIEVKNIAYEKTVFVRYTASDWKSSSDISASYVSRSEQKFSGYDTFSFQFPVPLDPEKPGRMEFAVCFVVPGQTFWDNNGGRNYTVVKVEEPRTTLVDDVIVQEFQTFRLDATHSEKGGSGCRKVAQQRQQQNSTDRIVFSVLKTRPVVWTEFFGWKLGMDYSLPYW